MMLVMWGIEDTGGQNVQREPAIVINNGVSRVGTALEADDHIRVLRQHVGDLAFPFVAPQLAPTIAFTIVVPPGTGFCKFCPIPRILCQLTHYIASILPFQAKLQKPLLSWTKMLT